MANKDTSYFGKVNFRGSDRIFGIKTIDRRQHMYVIGKTGTGKTVLLKNMAIQDIKNGHGLAIVDPHGEFVEEILSSIPEERAGDVIYFNPADQDFAIGFNVLEVHDPRYKHLVASGLMGIFTKIWANVWSARMEYILNNCILALIDTPGTTLLSVPRLLVDKDYREKIIANVNDPVVRSFWIHEYEGYNDRLRSEAIAPIQNKVGQFLNTPLIRNIVGQQKSTINFEEIMNGGKILLVNVSKGRIGEDNSALLGAMIITKLQLSAMERVKTPEEDRRDFFLYVDEFQNFATKSFASVLSEARKYRLNLIIAHQYTGQLVTEMDTSVRDAVFGNCGTMVIFRVGATDAEVLEPEFTPEFTIQDLVNLPNFHVYLKLMSAGVSSRPFSAGTLPPIRIDKSLGVEQSIIEASRTGYARPVIEVDKEIKRWSSAIDMISERSSQDRKKGPKDFELERERDMMPRAQPPKFAGHLSDLNIEFLGGGSSSDRREEYRQRPVPLAPRPQSIVQSRNSESTKRRYSAPQEVSLEKVLRNAPSGKKEQKHEEKPNIDLEGLRKSLAESLEKAKKDKQ